MQCKYLLFVLLCLSPGFVKTMHGPNEDKKKLPELSEEGQKHLVIGASLVGACFSGDLDSVKDLEQELVKLKGKETIPEFLAVKEIVQEGLLAVIQGQRDFPEANEHRPSIIEHLVQYGADVNHVDGRGYVPLHHAQPIADTTGEMNVFQSLLYYGADPWNKGKVEFSPLECSAADALHQQDLKDAKKSS